MTKDEALKLALGAGFRVGPSRDGPDDVWGVGANLERFAKLVEEKERESCWRMAENYDTGYEAATAIRARGEA
jgi:hypothetical protein